jgi:hypothetical protein
MELVRSCIIHGVSTTTERVQMQPGSECVYGKRVWGGGEIVTQNLCTALNPITSDVFSFITVIQIAGVRS